MRPFVRYIYPPTCLFLLARPFRAMEFRRHSPCLRIGMSLDRGGAAHSTTRTAGKSMMVGVDPRPTLSSRRFVAISSNELEVSPIGDCVRVPPRVLHRGEGHNSLRKVQAG